MIKIVTDSTPNLPPEIVAAHNIDVLPTYVHFGDVTYLDGVTLTSKEFYEKLATATELPSTSQLSVKDFEDRYRAVLDANPGTTILSMHISGALSGTVESARQAAALLPAADIRIFDSQSLALGHGLMVHEAARMIADGCSIGEILGRLDQMRAEVKIFWALDTLEYLAKSGRIGRAARLMGTLLDMKPILSLKNGAVDAFDKQRSRPRAIASVREMVTKACKGKPHCQIAVMHSADEAEAQKLADELRRDLHPEVLLISELGPSLGVYAGPRAIGLAWWVPEAGDRAKP